MTTTAHLPVSGPTPEELRRAESDGGVEYVDGQLVEKPVSLESSDVEATILILLGNEARKTKEARVYPSSMGYQCFPATPTRFRNPDVSLVRSARLAGTDPQTGLMPFPPDLAVEVLSPNDLAYDVFAKVKEYLSNGFPLVWVVYPNTRAVTIHRGDGSVAMLHEHDEITGEAALPSFRCKVAEFFPAAP